jgi:hypothetical protein
MVDASWKNMKIFKCVNQELFFSKKSRKFGGLHVWDKPAQGVMDIYSSKIFCLVFYFALLVG